MTIMATTAIETGFVIGDHHLDQDTVEDQEMEIILKKEEGHHHHPVIMIRMGQEVGAVLTAQDLVGHLHHFMVTVAMMRSGLEVKKEIPVCRCWCEILGLLSPPKISKWPSDGLEMCGMCISLEIIIHSNQKDLRSLNMPTSTWPGKHARRWIGFESRVVHWKSYMRRSDEKLPMK
jgi:hypothetical protein